MSVFNTADFKDHERVTFVNDSSIGLRAIIAIHNTTLGPALGGCRMWKYHDEEEALRDVLRLSRGMTYKASMAGIKLGGGKCVILGDGQTEKTPELMKSIGRAINNLNGEYITGPDIGTGVEDMTTVYEETKYAIGVSVDKGGYGDPSPSTARGVFMGIKAALKHKFGSSDTKGIKVAIQGVGHVGYNLCRLLSETGAELLVSDVKPQKVERVKVEFGAISVDINDIYDADVDIFSPCAFGAVINDKTIPKFKAKIIAGGANNQLDKDQHGAALKEKGIVYLPDYAVNGGGLVQVAAEWFREDYKAYMPKIDAIYDTCTELIIRAEADDIPTNIAADRIAEERIYQNLINSTSVSN